MSHAPFRTPRRTAAATLLAAAGLSLSAALPAQAQTKAPTINTVVLHMTGSMTLKFDKAFVSKLKKSKATISVKSGGSTYSGKKRTALLPIDSTSTITVTPASADIIAKGTVMFRRPTGQKAATSNIGLRLRDSGADLSGTVRGKAGREFAQLTASATINVQQTDTGYSFVDVLMLVSPDLAKAAKQAHIKGVVAGAPMGLMTAQITADLPSFTLPGIGNLVPGLGTGSTGIPGL